MPEYDNAYKLLFSFPEMVADLLRGFVREEWVQEVDFSTLEQVNATLVSTDFRDREDDIIWRVRWRDGWLYIYVLLEFQSRVERFMAVRVNAYVGLLYHDLVRKKIRTSARRLPPVFPVVLHTGDARWTAPRDVAELIEAVPGGLEEYRPHLRYLLLSESEFTEERLAQMGLTRNLVAALFRLENSRTPDGFLRILEALREWLAAPEESELRQAFTTWLRRVLLPRRLPTVQIPELRDLGEVQAMIAERNIDWFREMRKDVLKDVREEVLKDVREEVLKDVREEVLREGRQEGLAAVVERLMDQRFGPLDEATRQRIHAADGDTLMAWADKVLTAGRLEDIFS